MTVYNIETEKNHNYFAYGILVHNCRYSKRTKIITARLLDLRTGVRKRVKIFGPEVWKYYDTREIPPLQAMHTRIDLA